jgi:DNA-directed RNA polymerase specialized sigma subunit
MSAVKRHPTDAVILDVLSKTEIDPKNFPVILEGLKKERLQTEIAKDYGMTQMNVSRLLVLAKKRLKENLHAGIW